MRLTNEQQQHIINIFNELFKNINAELWLFGSRTQNNQLGGDIDLLIKCYELDYNQLSDLSEKYNYLLMKKIGNRKIDIILDFNDKYSNRPIIVNAKTNGILLTNTLGKSC